MSKVAIAVGGVGIVMIIAAMAGPWWSINFSISLFGGTTSGSGDFGLFGGSTRVVSLVGSQTRSISYGNATNVGSVFSTAVLFAVVGLLFGVGMMAANAKSGSQPRKRLIGGLLGLFAFLLTLLSAVYVMTSLPTAVNLNGGSTGTTGFGITGFWGSSTTTVLGASATITWAAGWGWYAVVVASVLF